MSRNVKLILAGIGVAILVMLALELLANLAIIFSIIIGLIVGGVVAAFLIAIARGEDPHEVAVEMATAARKVVTPTDDSMDKVTGALKHLNVTLRTEHGVGSAVLDVFESTVDTLVTVCDQLIERLPGDDLTFETCRIATYHLPRTFKPYLEAGDGRAEAEPVVLKALSAIKTEVNEISDLVQNESIDAARHRAAAVNARFANFGE